MIRRKSTPALQLFRDDNLRIIQDILLQNHPDWAALCRTGFGEING